jgi:lipoprotein-anchoring transpeptidase ErfK/SrfK
MMFLSPNVWKRGRFITLAAILSALVLQGCSSTTSSSSAAYAALTEPQKLKHMTSDQRSQWIRDRAVEARPQPQQFDYASIYAAQNDGGTPIVAFDYTKMNPRFLRQQVKYYGPERVGTIVVDARRRHLYLVQPNGMAMRYGIAVGKEGHAWTGNSVLQWKTKWPTWTPPAEMIARMPELQKYADGLKGSPANPLGARAMYLFQGGRDTLYRIHGTDKPHSIGKAASSGCFRMINQDVIDLYERVGTKGRVMVRDYFDESLVSSR